MEKRRDKGHLNAGDGLSVMGGGAGLADVAITDGPLRPDRRSDYLEVEWPDRVSGGSRIVTRREASAPSGG
ncbi:MAG: hypothetical protein C0395_00820 [Gemmatimonas sp.]|nr:hypothetical protein [Gemmatimonas sp.]